MSESAPNEDDCIRLRSLSKVYRRKHVGASLVRALVPGIARSTAEPSEEDFWALRNVSFEVKRGEAVAILGRNGSGKSTLLALLAGATPPSSGHLAIRGRVAPVLGLGVGFEADMSAVENAYLNSALLGISAKETTEHLPAILEFADLRDFVDVRVRHYSSGMLARLGFAVAMYVDADVLLVDEVLAVGDAAFQRKCLERVQQLRAEGVTVIFVTHDLKMAGEMCERGIWIDQGELKEDASIDACTDAYTRFLQGNGNRSTEAHAHTS